MSGKRNMRRNGGFFAISSTDFNLIALHSKYIEPASNHYLNLLFQFTYRSRHYFRNIKWLSSN
jgi:hypothetical protein